MRFNRLLEVLQGLVGCVGGGEHGPLDAQPCQAPFRTAPATEIAVLPHREIDGIEPRLLRDANLLPLAVLIDRRDHEGVESSRVATGREFDSDEFVGSWHGVRLQIEHYRPWVIP